MEGKSNNNKITPFTIGIFIITLLGAIIGCYSAMVAPINTQLTNLERNLRDTEARARTELDKSESGLKELTIRAEGIIRQTVEDVDQKLRREAGLIEEKSNIQFADMRRQMEELKVEIMLLRSQMVAKPPVVIPATKSGINYE
jgi:hypothetical protein